MKLGLYASVSTHEQQTLALQRDAMTAYAQQRRGSIVLTVEDIGSEVSERRQRDTLMRAARRREIDAIVVWRLDRWGRSLADLVGTLHELQVLQTWPGPPGSSALLVRCAQGGQRHKTAQSHGAEALGGT
jgi:putative DNA-invertase from lambdoid prophage Rac